jgi:hypothetical protein
MWDTTALPVPLSRGQKKVKVRGIPHLAKNERDMGHPTIPGREKEKPTVCGCFLVRGKIQPLPIPSL